MKRRIAFLPIVAIITAVLAAVAVARMQPRRTVAKPPAPPPSSQFRHTVAAVGLIEPSSESIRIGSHLSGVIDEVLVRAGDRVRAGSPLFRLETRHLLAALDDAEAALDVARSGVGVAEAALADEQQQLELVLAVRDKRAISEDDLQRRSHAVATAKARLAQAQAQVKAAEAARQRAQVEIDRSVVRSPITGTVLKVNVRSGEFAAAGITAEPLIIVGAVEPLFVRVDVDEHEAGYVRADANAIATLRGDGSVRTPLRFVRFEPLVVPKRALTGDSAERVDTRVLQVLYKLERPDARFFVGQQMDVFIDAAKGQS
ncbi:MAG TPA: efflux RND transporter periplasmic adaptor subunit [Thermoanaerobaculia bacterium]|jgi:RND family efflux transporter MFP subunit